MEMPWWTALKAQLVWNYVYRASSLDLREVLLVYLINCMLGTSAPPEADHT